MKLKHARDSWTYQREWAQRYGRAYTFHGLLKVCETSYRLGPPGLITSTLLHAPFQEKWLCTYDPRALHNIFIKDQDVFSESDVFIAYVALQLSGCKP